MNGIAVGSSALLLWRPPRTSKQRVASPPIPRGRGRRGESRQALYLSPEGAPEDGVDRGIAAFVICASLIRQFEFVQNVWTNDPNFHELGQSWAICGATTDYFASLKVPHSSVTRIHPANM
jgi:hypothetical protein